MTEEAYILFVRKNALQVLIPKYGIEGNIFLRDVTSRSKFDVEVRSGSVGCGGNEGACHFKLVYLPLSFWTMAKSP